MIPRFKKFPNTPPEKSLTAGNERLQILLRQDFEEATITSGNYYPIFMIHKYIA